LGRSSVRLSREWARTEKKKGHGQNEKTVSFTPPAKRSNGTLEKCLCELTVRMVDPSVEMVAGVNPLIVGGS
jgi:hypothetical protein